MTNRWNRNLAILLLPTLLGSTARGEDKTSEAIDRGIDYLIPKTEERLQAVEARFPNGPVGADQEGPAGRLAFQVYALVVAGVSVDHPTVKRSFETLARMSYTHTYSVALYVFALDAAISQLEDDLLMLQPQKVVARVRDDPNIGREYRPRLQSAVENFVRTQNAKGAWRYGPGAQDFDNSNVQFAVLALGVGAKRGVSFDPSVWMKVMDHFVKGQQKEGPEVKDRLTMKPAEERGMKRDDVKIVKKGGSRSQSKAKKAKEGSGRTGVVTAPKTEDPEIGTEDIQIFSRGWDYENKGGATWNMTCAGLSSTLLARDNLRGLLQPDAKQAIDKSIWDGYAWLMANWSPNNNYYGMYSLEKVGDIGEVAKFAVHDWYQELTTHLVGSQQPDGGWPKGQWAEDEAIATSYALLILNRATSLLAMDRTSKIVLSGKKSGAEGQEDRNWVYIRELDTSIHAPTLLRAVRLRPSPKLIRFLDRLIESYPDEYRGELVPDLVSVRDAVPNKSVQKIIDEYLLKITGYNYEKAEDYLRWTRRWKRVMQIGDSLQPKYKDTLIQYYKSTQKSFPLKKAVMWAMVKCKVREAIPLLLDDLDNADLRVRKEAYSRFRQFFIEFPPPFDPNGPEATRKGQIEAIRTWYAKQG